MKGLTFFLLLVSFSALHSQSITLRDTTNQFDYIIITVPEFVAACEQLKQHKETVRDFRTIIVDTTQIFAEFDSSNTPQGNIKDFISYAGTFWEEPKPKYFLLVGDLSKVPSFPDIFDFGPYLDTAFTDFKYSVNNYGNDTTTCSFQIGRVPAKYEFEIQNYFNKVVEFETDIMYSDWMNRNLFVKQVYPDTTLAWYYDHITDSLLSIYPEYFNNHIYSEMDTLPKGADRDSIVNYLNTVGANSLWLIGGFYPYQFGYYSLLDTADISLFDNGIKYFITFCFAKQSFTFDSTPNSLANSFLIDDKAAIAVIAPVGLGFFSQQSSLLYRISTDLFGSERKTLGSALNESRNSFTNYYTFRMLNLWGDPSILPKYDMAAEVKTEEIFPKDFMLYQNYPNPFNPFTTIQYSIPNTSNVTLKVYDILGNEIAILVNEEKPTGFYELTWNAENLPSGIYFYQLRAGDIVETKKMIILK